MRRETAGWAVAAVLAAGFAVVAPQRAVEPRTAHERCLGAANTPGDTGFATEVCEPLLPSWRESRVQVFEDGSGVQWIEGREVRRFEDGTFVWACEALGNRRCGR